MFQRFREVFYYYNFIINDEKWVYGYDIEAIIKANRPDGNGQKIQDRKSTPISVKREGFAHRASA